MEAILGYFTWQSVSGAAILLFGLWKTASLRKAAKELHDVYAKVQQAREDKVYTAAEVEGIIKEVIEALQAVAPLLVKLVKKFR